jgi:protein-disulfide isomerase
MGIGYEEEHITDDSGLITFTIRKTHLYVAVALLLGFAAGFGTARIFGSEGLGTSRVTSSGAEPVVASLAGNVVPVEVAGRPFRGPERAAITLVEFTDYQCPFCARHFRDTYPVLLREYDGKLKYVIRNYPVSSLHRHAQKAAEAAECALDQGEFWPYHDALFSHTTALQVDSLKRYAEDIGLNTAEFNRCLDTGEKADVVSRALEDGRRYGVSGTPTFFINGRILVGAQSLAVFKSAIDRASDAN